MTPQELAEFNGADLAALTEADLRINWLPLLGQPGWFVESWSHLLSGYPRAGKTELLIRLIREWLASGRRVALLSEESRHTCAMRLRGLEGDWSGLQIVCGLGTSPEELLMERAFYGSEAIVVVDTLRNLLQLQDERDNSEVARIVNPWTAGARAAGKTLVMAHHQRKGGGDHGEGISGAHALLGAFDIAIELKFDQLHPDRRLLERHPRLVDRQKVVYEKRGLDFVELGDPSALGAEELKRRVVDELSTVPQTTKAVLGSMGDPAPALEALRKALPQLALEGRILRDPDVSVGDLRGRTVRWSALPDPVGAQPNVPRVIAVGSEVGAFRPTEFGKPNFPPPSGGVGGEVFTHSSVPAAKDPLSAAFNNGRGGAEEVPAAQAEPMPPLIPAEPHANGADLATALRVFPGARVRTTAPQPDPPADPGWDSIPWELLARDGSDA